MTTFDDGPAVLSPPDPGEQDVGRPTGRRRRKLALFLVLLVVLGGFAAVFGWYLHTRKPLSELPGLANSKLPHYQFSVYGVSQPLGVAVTATGDRIYATQSDGARTVLIYDRSGKKLGALVPPASTGKAHTPVYVAVNPTNGEVYVSDRFTNKVYAYSGKGTYLREVLPTGLPNKTWSPLGLAFGTDGTLYATDVTGKAHSVLVISPANKVVRVMGQSDHLLFPNCLSVDKQGNVFVSDSNNGRIAVFGANGSLLTTVGRGVGEGDLGLPRGMALDDSGRLFVVDTTDHMVRVFKVGTNLSRPPTFLGSFGTGGQLDGTFRFPNGAAADSRGRIYVTDRDNNRVQVWSY
jgi:DNA-binding beta-propeller fold protein YncE